MRKTTDGQTGDHPIGMTDLGETNLGMNHIGVKEIDLILPTWNFRRSTVGKKHFMITGTP